MEIDVKLSGRYNIGLRLCLGVDVHIACDIF